jgi:hypothetical protein
LIQLAKTTKNENQIHKGETVSSGCLHWQTLPMPSTSSLTKRNWQSGHGI